MNSAQELPLTILLEYLTCTAAGQCKSTPCMHSAAELHSIVLICWLTITNPQVHVALLEFYCELRPLFSDGHLPEACAKETSVSGCHEHGCRSVHTHQSCSLELSSLNIKLTMWFVYRQTLHVPSKVMYSIITWAILVPCQDDEVLSKGECNNSLAGLLLFEWLGGQ